MKINKRNHAGTFHLYDHKDRQKQVQGLKQHGGVRHYTLHLPINVLGYEMKQVACSHEDRNTRIADDELRENLRMKISEDPHQHIPPDLYRISPKKDPAQTYQMKRQNHTEHSTKQRHLFSHRLEAAEMPHHKHMHSQRNTMQGTPQNKTHRSAVPQTAQQHRHNQMDIGAKLSLTVSAHRDIQVIFQPAR